MSDKVTAILGQDLKRKFKIYCTNNNVKMNDVVRDLVYSYTTGKQVVTTPRQRKEKSN